MNDTTTVADDGAQSDTVDAVTHQRVVRAMFDALDRGDIEQMVRYMTDDVVTTFGNFPELNGKAAFHMMFRDVAKSISESATISTTCGRLSKTPTCSWPE